MLEKLYTTAQAAEFLGVHPNTIRNMLKDGRLAAIKTRGKTGDYRFRQSDLEAYLVNEGNPGITVSTPENRLSFFEEKLQNQDELGFLIACGNPYRIFGSYLEAMDSAEYSQTLRGKSVAWVIETMRQIRLQFPHSTLSSHYRLEDYLRKIKIGISGMKRADGKIVITSFLIYQDTEEDYVLDGTLQQFYPNLKPGIVTMQYPVSSRYYWEIEQLSESAFQAAVQDRHSVYFRNYLQKLVQK